LRLPASNATGIFKSANIAIPDVKISIRKHCLRKKLYSKALPDTENTRKYYNESFPIAAINLNLNGVGVYAVQGSGADTSEHYGFLRQPASKATGIFSVANLSLQPFSPLKKIC